MVQKTQMEWNDLLAKSLGKKSDGIMHGVMAKFKITESNALLIRAVAPHPRVVNFVFGNAGPEVGVMREVAHDVTKHHGIGRLPSKAAHRAQERVVASVVIEQMAEAGKVFSPTWKNRIQHKPALVPGPADLNK
jgi:hypothetical protein